MNLWVTGGGTREPIDAVRYVGNRSTGRLSCQVVEDAVQSGHQVTAFLAAAVPRPSGDFRDRPFETATDLMQALLSGEAAPDALIHSAAVSDYAPEPQTGKVPSGRDTWTLTLQRQPKIVDAYRERYPESLLVLFKLEAGIGEAELHRRARTAAARVRADLVFANLLEQTGATHRGSLLWMDRDRVDRATGRDQISRRILEAVEELWRERHEH